jgi:hypothetical protein
MGVGQGVLVAIQISNLITRTFNAGKNDYWMLDKDYSIS